MSPQEKYIPSLLFYHSKNSEQELLYNIINLPELYER